MSVYVDPIIDYGNIARRRGLRHARWCHLAADTHDELVAMARTLGLRDDWIQDEGTDAEHYDLTPARRALAIREGALEVSHRELAALNKRKGVHNT